MYGDPVEDFMVAHSDSLKTIIQEDTEHQRVTVRHGWHRAVDSYRVTVICESCEKQWKSSITAQQLYGSWEKAFISDVLTPLIDEATADDCFGVREAALMAEWVTKRLAAAGERGIPYAQVVHEAVDARLVTPKDVDTVLRTMEFVSEWVTLAHSGIILPGGWNGEWSLPVLYLPYGHPLRTW